MEETNQNNFSEGEAKPPQGDFDQPFPVSPAVPEANPPSVDFSAKKWGGAGIFIAIVNPVFAGLILGALFLTEPKLRRFGVAVAAISIIWGAISYFLLQKYWSVSFSGF